MSANAKLLLGSYSRGQLQNQSVALVARVMGWGWHRTNNAMKELGLK